MNKDYDDPYDVCENICRSDEKATDLSVGAFPLLMYEWSIYTLYPQKYEICILVSE